MSRYPGSVRVLALLVVLSVVGCSGPGGGPVDRQPELSSAASPTISVVDPADVVATEPVEVVPEAPRSEEAAVPASEDGSSGTRSPQPDSGTADAVETDGDAGVAATAGDTENTAADDGADEEVVTPPSTAGGSGLGTAPEETVAEDQPAPEVTAPEPGTGTPGPIHHLLMSGSYRPDMDARYASGTVRVVVTGSVGINGRQVYAIEAAAGQLLTVSLDAPQGVWLDVRRGDGVVVSEADESRRAEATLPSGGSWRLSVVSSGGEPADYVLAVRVSEPEPEPQPEPVKQLPVAGPDRLRVGSGDVIYLTFDDGPHPSNTPDVLDLLARYGARATFFVLGSLVERHPDLFQRIVAEGHTVANHTWKHENLAKLSKADFDRTIGRTQEVLGDHATPCLRPPYAATSRHTRSWAADHGLEVYLWSVSANDWLGLDGRAIADRILRQVTDGSIVLMHDGGGKRPATIRGLELVLDRLSGTGIRYEPLCRASG